jgi:hypothetical protein
VRGAGLQTAAPRARAAWRPGHQALAR